MKRLYEPAAIGRMRALPRSFPLRTLSLLVATAGLLAGSAWANPSMEEEVMFSAAKAGNVALFQAMLKAGANANARDAVGNTALIYAALSDHDEMVREVLTHFVDLDVRGGTGMTALGIEAAHGSPLAVLRLLHAGANPSAPDAFGVTPLASALRLGRGPLALHLLAAGADPNLADRDGITPLHIAAEHGDADAVVALLMHGADPNRLDHDRRSPLFLALFGHHPEAAEALIRRRQTDLTLVTQGYSPEFWASQMGYEDIARSIKARIARG